MLSCLFLLAGNWAYVQRYKCIAKPLDVKKIGWLFLHIPINPGYLYAASKIYHVMNPELAGMEGGSAYLLMCKEVLSVGMTQSLDGLVVDMSESREGRAHTWENSSGSKLVDLRYISLEGGHTRLAGRAVGYHAFPVGGAANQRGRVVRRALFEGAGGDVCLGVSRRITSVSCAHCPKKIERFAR